MNRCIATPKAPSSRILKQIHPGRNRSGPQSRALFTQAGPKAADLDATGSPADPHLRDEDLSAGRVDSGTEAGEGAAPYKIAVCFRFCGVEHALGQFCRIGCASFG